MPAPTAPLAKAINTARRNIIIDGVSGILGVKNYPKPGVLLQFWGSELSFSVGTLRWSMSQTQCSTRSIVPRAAIEM